MTYLVDVYGTVIDEATDTAYADAPEFLKSLGNEVMLISSASSREDIERALTGVPRLTIMLTMGRLKADFLAEYPHLVPANTLFVDDTPEQLAAMEKEFPHVTLFEMRRDGREGDGRWPVVNSLSELP